MFSVDSEDTNRRFNPFTPYIRGGVEIVDFNYKGNPAEDLNLSFHGLAARAAFESGAFNLGLSFGKDYTGIEDHSYFALNLKFENPFYIIRRPNFGLGIPVILSTELTSVGTDLSGNEFTQTNLSAGAGGTFALFIPGKLGLDLQFAPSVGFSTASGGFIGGNVFSLSGKARVNFYNLIFGKNISLGYNYDYNSYNIDGEEFDYDLSGHTLTLGISF